MIEHKLFRDIRKDLKQVEAELNQYVDAPNPLLAESSAHLLKAGGKRLRPAFALLAAKFYRYSLEHLLPLAVALELIHMASLVHDDVVDASVTRRGRPTVRAQWGNRVSIHTGDYLFAKSLILISKYEDPRVAEVLSRVSVKMCQGEIQQISTAFDADQGLKDYFYRIKRKTALLISASCQLGAVVSGAPDKIVRALALYGYNLGMAFQITDDILDMIADEKELGKAVGSDLRQGIVTLPVIYAMQHSPQRDTLRRIVSTKDKGQPEVLQAIDIIKASGAIDYSFNISQKYIFKAKKQLEMLPNVKTKKTLAQIADFINIRRY